MMYPVHLVGEGIELRELISSDLGRLEELRRAGVVLGPPGSRREPRRILQEGIEGSAASDRRRFSLAVDATGQPHVLIGLATLDILSTGDGLGSVWLSLDPTRRGKGFGSGAGRLLIRFGLESLGLHRIEATCDAQDHGSARALLAMGMRLEGHLRHRSRVSGSWRDALLYAAIADEWVGPGRVSDVEPGATRIVP